MRPRAGFLLPAFPLLVLWAASVGAAAPEEPRLRVLLLETEGPVQVSGGSAGSGTRLAPEGEGLLAEGRPSGRVWRARSDASGQAWLRVGDLRVRGELEVLRAGPGLRVVNQVGLEDYVAGTLGREIYPDWEPEMLKAQAVVARTYALHRRARARGGFDLEGSTAGQLYGGVDAETPSVRRAARVTRGQYLSFEGAPILAAYHSASGGRTASAEEVWGQAVPYLVSLPVPDEEDSPDTYWRAPVDGSTLERALDRIGVRVGRVRSAQVVARSPSGRAIRVGIEGTRGSQSVSGRALRRALGADVIRSTLFEIRSEEDGVVFMGSGHGHGVGMSQWGGRAMARRGAGYREILSAFYPGTRLRGGGATP